MFKTTEKVDPLAFFDHLAANSKYSGDQDSISSFSIEQALESNIDQVGRFPSSSKLNTVRAPINETICKDVLVPKQNFEEDFYRKWTDFTKAYRVEKEALSKNLKRQIDRLDEVEQKFEKDNINLHNTVINSYNNISSHISKHKEKLRTGKTQVEKEKAMIKEIRKSQDEKIKLNVGGKLFETSLTTLRKDPNSMLADIFGENKVIKLDADNSYFIDRDGTHFRLILNYLRDLKVPSGIMDNPKIMDELMQEAEFYRLTELLKLKVKHN